MKNTDTQTIYFDLDGTVYDLYGQPDWLERITTLADPTAYAVENTLVDSVALLDLLDSLVAKGYTIGVISWLAKGSSKAYDAAVRRVKREWVKKFLPYATEVHIVKYGTPKHRVANVRDGILVDDNTDILADWTGTTVHAADLFHVLGRMQ